MNPSDPHADSRSDSLPPTPPGNGDASNGSPPPNPTGNGRGGNDANASSLNLSEPFIRRPVMTALLTLSAVLFGILAYRQLPVNDLPAVDYPVIQVQAMYPGATPDTMANNIATPLERQFMQIAGLQLVTSSSTQGSTTLVLQFDLTKSLDAAATDVQAAITQATGSLPTDLPSPPTFSKTNPNDQPIIYIGLSSDTEPQAKLYDYASTQVGERISTLPGVSRVQVYGSKAAVRVKADPSALAVRGMSVDDLAAGIRGGTAYSGAGQLDGPQTSVLLQPQGQLDQASQYNNLILGTRNGRPVYLKDVATAYDTVVDERINMSFWINGRGTPPATVVIAVYRQAGTNAVEVSKSIHELLPTIQATIPGSVYAKVIYDRSVTIVNSIDDVQVTLYIAFGLVVLVIFIFLGRATDTLIPAVALPLSLLLTFVVMNLLGYSLDNLSLMALTLAIGFLVDDAIVFLENTVRRMEVYGESPLTASLNSAREISFTILSMTVSLAAVFIPLVFMSGLMGRIFREFSITIVVAILASGVVSLTLTPLMCARMLGQRGHGAKKTLMERAIGTVERRVLSGYGRSLTWFLRHRWISAVIWVLCLAGTVWFFQIVPKSFLPVGDSSFIRGVMIAQEGTSPEQMHRFQKDVEAVMHKDADKNGILMTFTVSGISGFMPSNMGFVLAFLDDPGKRPPIGAVAGQIMGGVGGQVPGIFCALQANPVLQISTGATANSTGQYSYALSGIDAKEVHDVALRLMGEMAKSQGKIFATIIPDLYTHTPSLRIDILREQAKTYGVSPAHVLALLRNAYSQNYVYLIKAANDQYQVILEANDPDRSDPSDLSLLYIKSDDDQRLVPLSAVATWTKVLGPQSVNHINQFPSVTINFNLMPGVTIGEATKLVEDEARKIVPPSMQSALQGEALTFRQTFSDMVTLMFLAVFVMYVILGILYESYLHPLTVLSSLPVALMGGLATLLVFGQEASLYAFVGMFMLMGIVKKNGIMIVDFALQRIDAGDSAEKAIHDASMDRFRPIMMTTLAALMGAVPIALGFGADGSSRRPLGLVIVGGLIVSQFITLYITPVIYLYLEDFQEKVLDRIPFFRSGHTHHEGQTGGGQSGKRAGQPGEPIGSPREGLEAGEVRAREGVGDGAVSTVTVLPAGGNGADGTRG